AADAPPPSAPAMTTTAVTPRPTFRTWTARMQQRGRTAQRARCPGCQTTTAAARLAVSAPAETSVAGSLLRVSRTWTRHPTRNLSQLTVCLLVAAVTAAREWPPSHPGPGYRDIDTVG